MNWKAHRGIWIAIIVLVAVVIVFALLLITKPKPKAVAVEIKPTPVRVKSITVAAHRPQIMLYGVVESLNLAKLKAHVRSEVTEKFVGEGTRVVKGQKLLQLDTEKLQLQLRQHEAEAREIEAQIKIHKQQFLNDQSALAHEKKMMEIAEREFGRFNKLVKQRYVSYTALEKAEAEKARMQLNITKRKRSLNIHQFQIEQLNARLERSRSLIGQEQYQLTRATFVAPFDGVVNNIYVAIGGRVDPGQTVVEVLASQSYRVRATLPNNDLTAVRQALDSGKANVAQIKWQHHVVPATLNAISANTEIGQSSKDALFHLAKVKQYVAIGQTVLVYLPLLPIDHTAELPMSALHGNNRIYQVVDGQLQAVTIRIVGDVYRIDGSHALLVQAKELKDGEQILISDLPQAINGLRVKPQ